MTINLYSGSETACLAKIISKYHGIELGKVTIVKYADGEFQPAYIDNIRGTDVFIIQSTHPPSENLFELLMLIDAARRASARSIVAVIPYLGYARQDCKEKSRVSIASKLVANLLVSAGVNRIITLDLHSDQIQGFFDIPVDNLLASSIFIPYIQTLTLPDLIFASPDIGGAGRIESYAKHFQTDFVICYKNQIHPNVVEKILLIGDVKGKNVVIIDDLVDTGETILMAAQMIMEQYLK